MSEDFHIAQLRHAYQCLVNGWVKPENFKEFADGLLAPTIRHLEQQTTKAAAKATSDEILKANRAIHNDWEVGVNDWEVGVNDWEVGVYRG